MNVRALGLEYSGNAKCLPGWPTGWYNLWAKVKGYHSPSCKCPSVSPQGPLIFEAKPFSLFMVSLSNHERTDIRQARSQLIGYNKQALSIAAKPHPPTQGAP